MNIKIDSHQHFWQRARGDYHWLTPALAPLYQDFLPQDLEPQLKNSAINKTVVVQAAATVEETRFLLSLANAHDFIAGVVGWVDMASLQAPEQIGELSADPLFKGIRPMIQDIADPDWILQPALQPAFEALSDYQLTFDALVKPQHLTALLHIVETYPELRVVIDHAAKPDIAAGEIEAFDAWAEKMQAIASHANVYCKLSGLVTEAGERVEKNSLLPFVEKLLEMFGPDRLMWGSDWPVVKLVMEYEAWHALTRQLLATLSADEQAQIFGLVARDFYGLNDD